MTHKAKTKRSVAALIVLTPAMLDCFAIPLLVVANRQQVHFDSVPMVVDDDLGDSDVPTPSEPVLVELSSGGITIDDENISWQTFPDRLRMIAVERDVVVHANADATVPDFLRLSRTITDLGLRERCYYVSRLEKERQ